MNPATDQIAATDASGLDRPEEFRIPTAHLFTLVLLRHGFLTIAVLALLFLSGILLGIFVDIRALVVAFMILCIVAPMAMALLYIRYCMHPRFVFNSLPHTLRVDGPSLRVRIRTSYDPVEDDKDQDKQPEYREIAIPLADLQVPQSCSDGLLYLLRGGGAVIVPPEK